MLCQHCQNRIANVHYTQIVNGTKVEMYLCEQCANEKGQHSFGSPLNISDFLSGFFGLGTAESVTLTEPNEVLCDVCGMSYEDFKSTGKLGCSNCYKVFEEQLKPILNRLHGNVEHIGRIPDKVSKNMKVNEEIDDLKEKLANAVRNEEYEDAALIRDRIKAIEGAK
jgi:protein arginine kinase activator